MLGKLRLFDKDEDGAVTVDWVVLTATVVGLGLAVIGTLKTGPNAVGKKVSSTLANNVTVDLTNNN